MKNVLHDVYLSIQPVTDLAGNLENALKEIMEQVKKKPVNMYEREGKGEEH